MCCCPHWLPQAKLLEQYVNIINPLIDELRQRLAASKARGTGPGQASSEAVRAAIDKVGAALQVRPPSATQRHPATGPTQACQLCGRSPRLPLTHACLACLPACRMLRSWCRSGRAASSTCSPS
jgi:hypothetical protein